MQILSRNFVDSYPI